MIGLRRRGFRQRLLPFQARALRLERRFKRAIFLLTFLVVAGLVFGMPTGRYYARWLAVRARWMALEWSGRGPQRSEIDAERTRDRLHRVEQSREKLRQVYQEYRPPMQRLLRLAGLDPHTALVCWGDFDRIMLLPSTIFVPDRHGRSYRMRPNTRAVWVRNLMVRGGILASFPVPDTPELAQAAHDAQALVVAGSAQKTNSWGLRGPEPDTSAPLRGIVLGDSFMQGIFLSEDQTPPECLRKELEARLGKRVAILNTGHLGYSPEQYYYTLLECADRFRPQFVVVSVFANDFGLLFEVLEGKADWAEGAYWLRAIESYCHSHRLVFLLVTAPWVNQIEGPRMAGFYPGQVSNATALKGTLYLDPTEDFVDQHLALRLEDARVGKKPGTNPLFLSQLADGHFSAAGSALWARAVGRRLVLLIDQQAAGR